MNKENRRFNRFCFYNLYRRVLGFLVLLCFLSACEKFEAIVEDAEFYLDTDLLVQPASIQFVDATAGGNDPIENLKVRYLGPDSDQIFSLSGKLNPQPEFGVLDLFISPSTVLSPASPLEFTIMATASGYEDFIKTFKLRDTSYRFELVKMVNAQSPPDGVVARNTSFHTNTFRDRPIIVETAVTAENEGMSISLPAATQLFDKDGNELAGNIAVDLVYYDADNSEALEAFPGGLEFNLAIAEQGRRYENGVFTTAGFLSLEMKRGNRSVKTFSHPIMARMQINAQLFHPEVERRIMMDDKIPVWSLDEQENAWIYESLATVKKDSLGRLIAEFEMNHLSIWNLGWVMNSCEAAVSIQSDLLPASGSTALNTFLIHTYTITTDESGHRQEQFLKGFLQDLSDDSQITFYNVADNPELQDFKFKIYEGTGCDPNRLVHETKPFELLCNQTTDLMLNGVLPDRSSQDAIRTTVDISGKCVFEQDNDVIIRPTLRLFFREAGCGTAFNELGLIENGTGIFEGVEKGKTYDFLITIPEDSRILYNITIPTTDGTVDIPDFEEDIQFIYTGPNEVRMEYLNVLLPSDVCNDITG